MGTTRWEDIELASRTWQAALSALQNAQTATSKHLTDWAFSERLQHQGLWNVMQLVTNGRDTTFNEKNVAAADRPALWQLLRDEFERPAHVAMALYCAWLAQVLPEDPWTLGPRLTQALPTCPSEVRAQILQDCAPNDDTRPHPRIIDLVIEGIELTEALTLPGIGTVMHGQLSIDVAGLAGFRALHAKKAAPTG